MPVRELKAAQGEAQTGPAGVLGRGHPLGLDLQAQHFDVRPAGLQPAEQLDGGHRASAVAQVNDQRNRRLPQDAGELVGDPGVHPA
jgi:hypothetical protein